MPTLEGHKTVRIPVAFGLWSIPVTVYYTVDFDDQSVDVYVERGTL